MSPLPGFNLAYQSAEVIHQQMITFNFRTLSRLLIQQKGIPAAYFRKAADALQIPSKISRKWTPNRWPHQNIKSHDRLVEISMALCHVWMELRKYPVAETFWEAHTRLVARVNGLRNQNVTYNQIANYLMSSHTAFTEMLARTPEACRHPRHCPWSLLEALRDATPDKILANETTTKKPALKLSASLALNDEITIRQKVIAAIKRRTITEGDDCLKCGQPWSALRFENVHPEFQSVNEFICFNCGYQHFTGPVIPVLLHRRSPCQHCGASRNNLAVYEVYEDHPNGQSVMICKACEELCLRPAPIPNAPGHNS